MVASEAFPFSKTGGLADVASALPKALGRLGHHVTLITPRYRGIDAGPAVDTVRLEMAGRFWEATLHEVPLGPGARVLFLDCPPLYDRPGIYNQDNRDYDDNALRFAFLSAAAVDWQSRQAEPAHVIHAHDWQAGLTPVYARRLPPAAAICTVHNLAYQGIFDKAWVPPLGLTWDEFTVGGFEFYDRLSFLKAGVNASAIVTTVSPTYAGEVTRPEYGYGFEGVMQACGPRLIGILNGIDADEWNPAADRHLPAPYDASDLSGKALAKRALLETYGLPTDADAVARPVIGMVSRMVDQKGLDLIAALASELPFLDATFTILGTGDTRYQEMWRGLAAWRPDRIGVHIGYDERRAHLIEGGADMFMVPSRFEPCGLNQMYSLRYGTIPVVRAVGGLVDTVRPYSPANGAGTGFLFSDYTPDAFRAALTAALTMYRQNRKAWARLQKNGMRKDWSWDRSAAEYVKVYKRVMASRRGTPPTGPRHPKG